MDGPYNAEVAYTKPNHIYTAVQCSLRSMLSLCLSLTSSPSPKGYNFASNSTLTVHHNCIKVDGENHTPTDWGEIVLDNCHLRCTEKILEHVFGSL